MMCDPGIGQAVTQYRQVVPSNGFVGDDNDLPASQQRRDFLPSAFQQPRSDQDFAVSYTHLTLPTILLV